MDQGSGFINNVLKIFQVDFSTNEEKIDRICIFSPCEITRDISFLNGSQVSEHLIYDLVEANILAEDVVDIGEKGMVDICLKDFPVLFFARNQQSCLLEAVQLKPDGIGRFVEFRFQDPQIGFGVAVQEEPEQQLNTRFTGD